MNQLQAWWLGVRSRVGLSPLMVDIGSAQTKILGFGRSAFTCPTCIVKGQSGLVVVGKRAEDWPGGARTRWERSWVVQSGKVVDVTDLQTFLKLTLEQATQAVSKARGSIFHSLFSPEIFLAVPSDTTALEREQWMTVVKSIGEPNIFRKSELYQIWGSENPQKINRGICVDIGAQTLELCALWDGAIVGQKTDASELLTITHTIRRYIRERHQLHTSWNHAGQIARELLYSPSDLAFVVVRGKHVITALPASLTIPTHDLLEVVAHWQEEIVQKIAAFMATLPISTTGAMVIQLLGGGSKAKGLDDKVARELDLSCMSSSQPGMELCLAQRWWLQKNVKG